MARDPWPNLRPTISDVGKKLVAITAGSSDFAVSSLIYAASGGSITYIPEPGSLVLLVFSGFAMLRRRR